MDTTHAPKPQVRAACYCRISSDPKDKREGVDRQREDTAALCELKDWQIAGVYIDNDRSASNGKKRPEWDRLLADIEAGKIDAVAAWDQDRVNRMMNDFVAYKKLFVKRGVLLATSNNGDIDLSTPSGVLTATIKTAVSEHEVSMMRIRQRRAARQRAEQGRPKWRKAFGYLDMGGDRREPDPRTAPLVAEGYRALLAGKSISDIARSLNAAGAYGLNGKPWSPTTLSIFLRKPRNAGLRAHNGEIVGAGNWPPLVDESTWRTAQSILNAPGRARPKTVRRHKLTGVLGCGKCGHHLSGYWSTKKTLHYRCQQCHGVAVRSEHVEPLLMGIITGRLVKPDARDLLLAEIHDEAEAEAIRAELVELYAELQKIGIERGKRLLTGEQAKIASDLIAEDIANLEARQQDQERLRLFADIPIGTPEAAPAIEGLSADRLRAIIAVLATITVGPVGKGHRANGERFDPERVHVDWR
jgi:DNA invertase Pin-like site-specific DNA recombinase